MRDPTDTLVVTGGARPGLVDTAQINAAFAQVREAERLLGEAAALLRQAGTAAGEAAWNVARALAAANLATGPVGFANSSATSPARSRRTSAAAKTTRTTICVPGQGSISMSAAAIVPGLLRNWGGQAGEVGRSFGLLSAEAETLGGRLVRAAGLYEAGEAAAAGGMCRVNVLPVALAAILSKVLPESEVQRRLGRFATGCQDEFVADLGLVLGFAAAPLSGGDPSITGAARAAATVGNGIGRIGGVSSRRVPGRWAASPMVGSGETDAHVDPAIPAGRRMTEGAGRRMTEGAGRRMTELGTSPTVSSPIAVALSRMPALTGTAPEAERAGVPAGTFAIERYVLPDGTTSWTVLIPGTQTTLIGEHVFDGLSDVQLMGHEQAQILDALDLALTDAGAMTSEPVVLIGHSLGGITATAAAATAAFSSKFTIGGVVTAGSPTATFTTPPGVPVLHLENDEDLVSALDGRSGVENPATADRVTVTRSLADSSDALDLAAVGSLGLAHGIHTHLRTLAAAQSSGNYPVMQVTQRIEALMPGEPTETRFYATERTSQAGADGVESAVEPNADLRAEGAEVSAPESVLARGKPADDRLQNGDH